MIEMETYEGAAGAVAAGGAAYFKAQYDEQSVVVYQAYHRGIAGVCGEARAVLGGGV